MAEHYIRAGTTSPTAQGTAGWGNGQAASALPATLVRGDTYYVAAGSYGSYDFTNVATSGATLITVKKATVANHGAGANANVGWLDSYATGQAVWTDWTMGMSFLTIDGVTGGGPPSSGNPTNTTTWSTGHGIAVRAFSAHLVFQSGALTDLTMNRVEFDGTDNTNGDRDIFYFVNGTSTNVIWRRCYLHHIGSDFGQMYSTAVNWVWEYCYVTLNNLSGDQHGDFMENGGTVTNLTARWNFFDNIRLTYCFGSHDPSGQFNGGLVYGNIFRDIEASNGLIAALTNPGTRQYSNVKFLNNTIVSGTGIDDGMGNPQSGTGNEAYNNIWVNESFGFSAVTHNYNASNSSLGEANGVTVSTTVFTNYQTDLTLSGTFPANWSGTNTNVLVPGNSVDMMGTARLRTGSIWDRGAFAFGSGGGADTTPPAAPTGVTVN